MKHQKKSGSRPLRKRQTKAPMPQTLRSVLVDEERERVTRAIVDAVITPNAVAVERIFADGHNLAVVVRKPGDDFTEALRELGWDESAPVFKLSDRRCRRFANRLVSVEEYRAADWLRSRRSRRILVFWDDSMLLLSYTPGRGYSLEPYP